MNARILGLDLARGLAVMGMVASHVGDEEAATGWPWLIAAHGRSSALFAVLAGVTIALMLARTGDDALALRHTRARVATRAGLLIALGLLLTQLATPVDIILVNLGLLMLMTLPVLRWPSWALAGVATLAAALGLAVVVAVRPGGWMEMAPIVGRLWSVHYPALAWVAYIYAGVVIGRLALRSGRTQAVLVGVGTMLAGGAAVAVAVVGVGPYTDVAPHSYTPAEMTLNLGVAAATIGACCWVAPRMRAPLSPVTAMGSMALSAYVFHLLVIAAVGREMVYEPTNVALATLLAVMLAIAWAWRRWLGQGPLERILTLVSNAAGDRAVRTLPARGRVGA